MIHPQPPRSYKVKATRRDISSSVELLPLPSPYVGAYRSFKTCIEPILAQKVINILEYNNSTQLSDCQLLSSVQRSGDGASFSKSTSYILLSFSFPSLCKDVLAGTGN